MTIKYVHTNLITDDWQRLARFYTEVFGCVPLYPTRDLRGDWIDAATGLTNAHFVGTHLALPGYEPFLPTLEIFQYDQNAERLTTQPNRKGFGHICFRTDDVPGLLNRLLDGGGSTVGDIVQHDVDGVGTLIFVYARDPDGNIIELQQWS